MKRQKNENELELCTFPFIFQTRATVIIKFSFQDLDLETQHCVIQFKCV